MSIYLDTNALVALFLVEPASVRIFNVLRSRAESLIVSDFAAVEFASAIARRTRVKDITQDQARDAFAKFDGWTLVETVRAETSTQDIARAAMLIRRLDLTLRAPDAIHIAIAQRLRADLFTLDQAMAGSARLLGINVVKE